MKRRSLLATLGTAGVGGLAGCLGNGDAGAEGEFSRRVSLESQDSVADTHEISIDVELLASRVTRDRTARLRISTTNEGPRRAISIGDDGCDLFNRGNGASDPPGLWLHDPDRAEYIERNGDRWVADRPADDPRGYAAYGCLRKTYEAGKSRSNEYVVWDDYRVEGYMTPGTYRWEERVSVAESTEDHLTDDERWSFPWGFSLRVEAPDP